MFCAFHDLHVPIPIQLPQRNSASAAHVYVQLTHCFSAVAELLVCYVMLCYVKVVVLVRYIKITVLICCMVLKSAQNDWQLRGTFFDCIVGVAAYVGWQSSIILKPLLQQVSRLRIV